MASPKHSHRHHRAAATKHRRPLALRRAMLHSCVCFLVGLVTGLAPSDWTDAASRAAVHANGAATAQVFRALHAMNQTAAAGALGQLLALQHYQQQPVVEKEKEKEKKPLDLVVVVTTTTTSTGLSERERQWRQYGSRRRGWPWKGPSSSATPPPPPPAQHPQHVHGSPPPTPHYWRQRQQQRPQ
ncbi:putative beta-14-xylosyltransferase IRX9 [Zea mays]|uniref:Putative beta-14-xylosyltransferase IRX9 n=1 Tax=Zea mays TaxID=4577 RepID=A0A1D6F514_MAIZE|nr:putative beta-14-xylosyltransferase IRX9 [Zea mays]